jgi:hypothetical protein
MNFDEFKNFLERVEKGEATPEEDLAALQMLDVSLDMMKFFLQEIKVAKLKQDLNK